MKEILSKRFPNAVSIKVEDISGGCGAMYEIYVETGEFKGMPMVKQHRSVYDALKEQIKHIHGLQLVTKAPPWYTSVCGVTDVLLLVQNQFKPLLDNVVQ